eukprot:CAMPEP_0196578792 /NCGR_PEP_ID=MMETSP1081-20130531/7626_1 /TAXON_ID=36882 /ORGANISM="Pyramimonas amylifera, Strain CCMP720" /LENGTH=229 /DNA_ID=CAMNT_0041898119 /DNA_START=86 /DNA_END=775 /DNA_ORIENTATION=+
MIRQTGNLETLRTFHRALELLQSSNPDSNEQLYQMLARSYTEHTNPAPVPSSRPLPPTGHQARRGSLVELSKATKPEQKGALKVPQSSPATGPLGRAAHSAPPSPSKRLQGGSAADPSGKLVALGRPPIASSDLTSTTPAASVPTSTSTAHAAGAPILSTPATSVTPTAGMTVGGASGGGPGTVGGGDPSDHAGNNGILGLSQKSHIIAKNISGGGKFFDKYRKKMANR